MEVDSWNMPRTWAGDPQKKHTQVAAPGILHTLTVLTLLTCSKRGNATELRRKKVVTRVF